MRFHSFFRPGLLLAFVTIALLSCKTETEDFTSEAWQDYMPLAKGKYIVYRLDSTVFTNYGAVTEIHRYQEKHEIDTIITDNLGRTAYRIYIYQRDSAGTQPWNPTGTYTVTPLNDQVEVNDESNFRIIKMHMPLRDGYSWKGNRYLTTAQGGPYSTLFNFSNDDNMADWDFYYDGGPGSFSYNGNTYADVYSVEEADEAYNVPITDPNAYAAKSRSLEKYSRNIGMVYKEYELWEYQPNPGGTPYKTGFGVRMWMTDHN